MPVWGGCQNSMQLRAYKRYSELVAMLVRKSYVCQADRFALLSHDVRARDSASFLAIHMCNMYYTACFLLPTPAQFLMTPHDPGDLTTADA